MRTLLLVGSLAAVVLTYVYQWYNSREREYTSGHGSDGPRTYPADDFIRINETTSREKQAHLPGRTLPGLDEQCSICLDPLMRAESRKYCIISLQCGHWFHQRCAIRLLEYHPQCPVCRVDIDSSMLRRTPVIVPESREGISDDSSDASTSRDSRH